VTLQIFLDGVVIGKDDEIRYVVVVEYPLAIFNCQRAETGLQTALPLA